MQRNQAIVVINLKHRKDRRLAMERQLAHIGWNAEFFPAVRPTSAGPFPSIGARGCFLSHLAVLQQAEKRGVDRLVILEDDLNFVREFRQLWTRAMSELAGREWSMFYPGHVLEDLPAGLSLLPANKGVRCSHFIVVNGPAIGTLVAALEKMPSRPVGHPLGSPMHVDGAYTTIRKYDDTVITYAYSPVLGYQRSSRTDVGEPKWFDRVDALARVVNLARNLKTGLKS